MGRVIKATVSTGWANGDHIDTLELPEEWDTWSEEEQTNLLEQFATECLHETCQGYAEVVDEDEL